MKVNIIKFDHFGRGIGRIGEKIIFVDKTLPLEIVDVNIKCEKKNYYEGEIVKIIKPSKLRVKAKCPFYDKCGGCDFLHTTYDVEKDFKKNLGIELLGKVDNFYEINDYNYRNKVTLHVDKNNIGYYSEKTHEIVPVDNCLLLDDNINKVLKDLQKIAFSNYHVKTIIIKSNQNKLLLSIDDDIDNNFLKIIDYVDTVICNGKIVKGNGFIEEIIKNKIFKITSDAFFQVNKKGIMTIYQIIENYIKSKKISNVLDLYSGTGLWGILISNQVNKVMSIEINKEACLNAKDNLLKNMINNIEIINGDVKDYLDKFKNIDLVIVDPPRSGLDKKTREYLRKISSKYLIYISCDIQTLKRDLQELGNIYDILKINLVDMFKGTYHCESICLLERK